MSEDAYDYSKIEQTAQDHPILIAMEVVTTIVRENAGRKLSQAIRGTEFLREQTGNDTLVLGAIAYRSPLILDNRRDIFRELTFLQGLPPTYDLAIMLRAIRTAKEEPTLRKPEITNILIELERRYQTGAIGTTWQGFDNDVKRVVEELGERHYGQSTVIGGGLLECYVASAYQQAFERQGSRCSIILRTPYSHNGSNSDIDIIIGCDWPALKQTQEDIGSVIRFQHGIRRKAKETFSRHEDMTRYALRNAQPAPEPAKQPAIKRVQR